MAKILLVERQRKVAAVIASALRRVGHHVTIAATRKRALARFAADHSDLVLTDIPASENDGADTIQAFRKEDPTVPIIAMSDCGRRMNDALFWAVERAGATEILRKPIPDVVLAWVIERSLRKAPNDVR